jgi:hypothetical protein
LRVRTALLVASFIIAYFLGLTYAMLRASTYYGVEYSAFLVLVAAVLGILAVKYTTRFAAPFSRTLQRISDILLRFLGGIFSARLRHNQMALRQRKLRVLDTLLRCLRNSEHGVRFRFQRPGAEVHLILLGLRLL